MIARRTGIVVVALGVGLAALLVGDAATVGVAPRASDTAKPASAAWSEVKWPFPLDQWGVGRAFHCRAADCGSDIDLYLRAKLGFCNCTTGVSDDTELDRVGDLELLSDKFNGLRDGQPISVGWMNGRSRPYRVAIPLCRAAHRARHRLQRQMRRGGRDRRRRRCRGRRARRLGLPQRRSGAALGREGARAVMRSAVVVFPGINRERDMARALRLIAGREPAMVWHADTALPAGTDLVVVPGGFSYGDYLRCGAIAARAPIMDAVRAHAAQGRARARRLQRLPDPLRVGAAARRADAQRGAQIHLPRRLSAGRALRHAVHPRLQCRPGDPRAGRPRRGQLRRRRARPSRGSKARAGCCSATPRRTARSIPPGTSTARPTPSPACSTSAATCSA